MPLGNQSSRPAFHAAEHAAGPQAEARPSTMVEQDCPHPAPRPSPELADEADRLAFNARWDREAREAEAHNREARREAFKAARCQEPDVSRSRTFNRTVNR